MIKLLTFFIILFSPMLRAQTPQQLIKQHYHKMDSLWNNDKYAELINYAKGVESFFKENNKYPMYDYYRLLVSYLGDTYIENGDYGEAEDLLLHTLTVIEKDVTRLHPVYSDGLYEMGKLYMLSGRFSKAYTYYEQAWKGMEFWRKLRWWKYIKTANELINICTGTGKYQDAEYYANKIEQSIPEAGYSNEELVDYYITRSLLYTQMMSVYKAELYIKKANELLPKTAPNIFTQAELKNIMSMIYVVSGRKDSAEKILTGLINDLESKKMKNTDATYLSVANLASILFIGGKYKMADSILTYTLKGVNKPGNKFVAALYMNLALVQLRDGLYIKALASIDTALSMVAANASDEVQFNLPARILKAIILLKMNQSAEAYELYNNVMDGYINYIRENIGYLSESEKNNMLMSYYNLANFSPSFITKGTGPENESPIRKAWEQQLFFKGLAAGEQTRLYSIVRKNKDTAVQALYTEWQELRQYIQIESQKPAIVKNKNLPALVLLAEHKEKELALYMPAGKKNEENVIEQIYKHLQPGEALVDFSQYMRFTQSREDSVWYGAYILRYGNPAPVFINICSENKINELLEKQSASAKKYLPGILYPPDGLNKKHDFAGDKLFGLVWKPLQPFLAGIKTIYIVADGLLYKVAFHALPLTSGGFLCDKADIHYLYYAEKLCDSNFRDYKRPSRIQCWGGITYDTLGYTGKKTGEKIVREVPADSLYDNDMPDHLDFLPGTLRETEAIGRLCKASGIPFELFSGNAANEQSFKQYFSGPADIVHIGTHGRFDPGYFSRKPDFQLYSNLRFTPVKDPMNQVELYMAGCKNNMPGKKDDAGNDGRLKAGEIARLDATGKQLIVLTACESGSGDIISAEGVFGLVRAFKMAGAEKIIVSLWEVDDEKANEMMLVLYKSILNGTPVNTAFKQAQQYMRKKKYPPYLWAGFILVE